MVKSNSQKDKEKHIGECKTSRYSDANPDKNVVVQTYNTIACQPSFVKA